MHPLNKTNLADTAVEAMMRMSKLMGDGVKLVVEIVEHCHPEEPMYILSPIGMFWSAKRGYPKKIIKSQDLSVHKWQIEALDAFLIERGIPKPQEEPAWHLCSYWSG